MVDDEKARSWWSRNLWVVVLFPVLAALLMIPVGLLQGWLHHWYGPPDKPAARPRGPVALTDGYRHIVADLKRRDAEVRPNMRYLTLWHRHNDPDCPDADLDNDRRALRELLTAVGKADALDFIDPEQLILPVNLEMLDWEPTSDWRALMGQYRYGLSGGSNEELTSLRRQVEELTQERLPVVRGDWFVVAASRKVDGKLPDSVTRLVQGYGAQVLAPAACARELGLQDETPLLQLIRERDNLQKEFGLAALLRGESIRREWWESGRYRFSPYQELARLLKLGKPVPVQ